jgi:hypothetical protein
VLDKIVRLRYILSCKRIHSEVSGMIHEDVVTCEGCGAEITHIVCGNGIPDDPDYYTCAACIAERDDSAVSVSTSEG